MRRAPPPSPILRAELEVAHHNAYFCASRPQDEHHHEEEAEDVVDLVLPDSRHDEEELDADRAKAEEAADEDRESRAVVPRRGGHDPLDHLRSAGHLVGLLLQAEVASDEHQRQAEAQPERQELEDRGDRHGRRAPLRMNHDLEDQTDHRQHAGPAKIPDRKKQNTPHWIKPPRFAGLRKPSKAKTSVQVTTTMSWTPVPIDTESSIGYGGARKTSPWTFFHPCSA
eukprot:scaffold1130_cov195-Pinguiococcus_pyrenoidosus.AAC.81